MIQRKWVAMRRSNPENLWTKANKFDKLFRALEVEASLAVAWALQNSAGPPNAKVSCASIFGLNSSCLTSFLIRIGFLMWLDSLTTTLNSYALITSLTSFITSSSLTSSLSLSKNQVKLLDSLGILGIYFPLKSIRIISQIIRSPNSHIDFEYEYFFLSILVLDP
jgi:hypothetical protein